MKKRTVLEGAIGNSDRQNRDDYRVMARGGTIYTLKAHIDKAPPLVIRKVSGSREKSTTINGE